MNVSHYYLGVIPCEVVETSSNEFIAEGRNGRVVEGKLEDLHLQFTPAPKYGVVDLHPRRGVK